MIHFRVRYERLTGILARSRWRLAIGRGAWLALLAPLAALALAHLGWTPPWLWVWAAGLCLWAASAWYLGRSLPPADLGRRLDRRFGLGELLTTAIEVDGRGPRTSVETRLLDDAALAVAAVGEATRDDGPALRREVETAVAVLLIAAGLWLVAGPPLPQSAQLPALQLAASSLGIGPGSGDPIAAGRRPGAPGDLLSVADTLGDLAVAVDLTTALRAGEAAEAARVLQGLADRTAELTPAGRRDLAAALGQAGERVKDPKLRQALNGAAKGMSQPDQDPAAEALVRLAAALGPASQGPPLATSAPQAGPPAARIGTVATAVPLEQRPGSGAPAARAASGPLPTGAGEQQAPAAGSPVLGDLTNRALAGGWDPQSVPAPLRPMVRRYFARQAEGR